MLNSHSPVAQGFKAPLRSTTISEQKEKMIMLSSKLMGLRLPTGELAVQHGRRMSIISLAFTLKSISELAEELFQRKECR